MPRNRKPLFALTSAYVELLHDEGVAMFWPGIEPVGRNDCINLGLLESSARQPFQSAFGEDCYPAIHEKAACLFHSLIANHCFNNGNKRTGVLALDQFLYANGYVLTIPNEDMRLLAEKTASYRADGIPHKEMFTSIAVVIESSIVPFLLLKMSQSKFYKQCLAMRREIRNHPCNQEGSVPQQSRLRYGLNGA